MGISAKDGGISRLQGTMGRSFDCFLPQHLQQCTLDKLLLSLKYLGNLL